MPQFDFTTLFSVTIALTLSWVLYYSFFSISLLSDTVILLKFRVKIFEQTSKKFLKTVSLPGTFMYQNFVSGSNHPQI